MRELQLPWWSVQAPRLAAWRSAASLQVSRRKRRLQLPHCPAALLLLVPARHHHGVHHSLVGSTQGGREGGREWSVNTAGFVGKWAAGEASHQCAMDQRREYPCTHSAQRAKPVTHKGNPPHRSQQSSTLAHKDTPAACRLPLSAAQSDNAMLNIPTADTNILPARTCSRCAMTAGMTAKPAPGPRADARLPITATAMGRVFWAVASTTAFRMATSAGTAQGACACVSVGASQSCVHLRMRSVHRLLWKGTAGGMPGVTSTAHAVANARRPPAMQRHPAQPALRCVAAKSEQTGHQHAIQQEGQVERGRSRHCRCKGARRERQPRAGRLADLHPGHEAEEKGGEVR